MGELNVEIVPRKGTAAEWAASSYVLKKGEVGQDTTNGILKLGDGTSKWSQLPITAGGVLAELGSAGQTTPSTNLMVGGLFFKRI